MTRLIQDAWLSPSMRPGHIRRAMPYQIARSSLFAGVPANVKVRRTYSAPTQLPSYSNFQIFQSTGLQLTQTDGSVWLELLHVALQQPDLGSAGYITVAFTENGLLRALGKKPDSKYRKSLRETLLRLAAVEVTVDAQPSWVGRLLHCDALARDDLTSTYVQFDRALAGAFKGGYTLINLEQRNALREDALAQWMHGFYSSHRTPRPLHDTALRQLSGCTGGQSDKKWLEKLRLSLARLGQATRWKCEYNPTYRVVQVDRRPR